MASPPVVARGGQAPAPWIRSAVREVLERAPNYRNLSADDRRSLAGAMVRVSALAAELIDEEGQAQQAIVRELGGGDQGRPAPMPMARAQSQPGFAAAADRVAGTTQAVLNAVSFPRFVTDLINGVFRAMLDSSTQQMQQYVQLLNAVSASAEGFEQTQFGLAQVRQWVADHFPDSIEYETPDPDFEPDPEEVAESRLRLRSGASMPDEEAIRATLGMEPGESVDASNPEQLVPLARRYLARQRQQMLATMVMMGMHRIVIDSGRINAAMRFHVDTRSAASEDRGSQFSLQNRVRAAGSFGVGPWGASAEIENNIGYVSTQRNQSTEEMNTDLELNSSVELNFRSDYLPLNRMAAQAQADRIRNASINPVAEADPSAARTARLQAQHESERARRSAMDTAIGEAGQTSMAETPLEVPRPNSTPQRPQAGGRGTTGGAATGGTTTGGTTTGGTTTGGTTTGGTTTGGTTTGGTTTGGATTGGATTGGATTGGATTGGATTGGATTGGATTGGRR
ncbi:hypothetical protein [Marilutibacter chinensis]|uniref:Uncharacterized protein n=1 Tax=Marilutibacter chinensis TaxID=2912247 RepID=A0ABS9HPJ5_9GAMM|nr:hypothetical protein [Lysobacter chinensis]MCF7220869.1 hypothetical protein [Lysobacter chinensis]